MPSTCVYICGCRVHHGLIGALLAAIGLALMLHDRRDAPWRPLESRR